MYRNLGGKMIGLHAVLLVLFMAVGYTEEERTDTSGQWKYVVEDRGAKITGCVEEPHEDVVFPSELDGYAVTCIGGWVSEDCDVTSVVIPDSVTRIGASAFAWYCYGLSSVTIPESVTSIGAGAFYYCDLTSVTIPASVTDIGSNPFEGNPMTHIDVATDNPVYEQVEGVLFDKQQKMLVSYPHIKQGSRYAIPEGVLCIGESAFSNNGVLMSVIIPDTVASISDMAFYACVNLSSVTIPDGVTEIGFMAFSECDSLAGVTIPESVTSIGEEAFGWDSEITLYVVRGSYAEQYAEENGIYYTYSNGEEERTDAGGQWKYVVNADGETVTIWLDADIPAAQMDVQREIDGFRVTAIGDYAFESSTLERITLPDTVISIGDSAFLRCFSLTGITLPDSLISIGDGAFADSSLRQITLPGSLISIGRGAFSMCDLLTEITLPESLTSIGINPWDSCVNLIRIEVLPGNPVYASLDGVLFDQSSGMLHTYPCGKEGSVYAVPDGVTAIGELAFYDCDALTQVILPDSLTSINEGAFYDCVSLTRITLPDSLTSIGEDAFYGCGELTLVVTKGSIAERYAEENGIPYVFATDTRFEEMATLIGDLTVNIRSGPGTNYAQIGEAYPGASFYYTGITKSGFLEIVYPDINLIRVLAYVNKDLAKVFGVGAEDAIYSSVAGYLRVKPKTQVYFDASLSKKMKQTLGDGEDVPFAGVSSSGSYAVLYTTVNKKEERPLWIGYVSPKDVVEVSVLGE